jgi:hypothetical protein
LSKWHLKEMLQDFRSQYISNFGPPFCCRFPQSIWPPFQIFQKCIKSKKFRKNKISILWTSTRKRRHSHTTNWWQIVILWETGSRDITAMTEWLRTAPMTIKSCFNVSKNSITKKLRSTQIFHQNNIHTRFCCIKMVFYGQHKLTKKFVILLLNFCLLWIKKFVRYPSRMLRSRHLEMRINWKRLHDFSGPTF